MSSTATSPRRVFVRAHGQRHPRFIEPLEGRCLLSATTELVAPGQLTGMALHQARDHGSATQARRASLVPADIFGAYGGSYNSMASFGDVVMTVTSARKSQFTGTLTFIELDGNTISGSYKAKMGANYSLKLTMKSGRTKIKATGNYRPDATRPAFIMTMNGRFDGQKLGRFGVGGAFAVMKDLGV